MIEFKMKMILYHLIALCIICASGEKNISHFFVFWAYIEDSIKNLALWVSASHPLLHLDKENSS